MAAVDFVLYDIFTADAPAIPGHVSWTAQPHLIVGSLTRGASPTLSQASLSWNFGTMSRAHSDDPDAQMAYVAPINLQGKYVLIVCEELSISWVGFVPGHDVVDWNYEEDEAEEQRPTGGGQSFTAYGLEYFLGRTQVTGKSSREADKPTRPFSYNTGSGDGRDLDQAKRGNRTPPTDDPTDALDPGTNDAYDPLEFSFDNDSIEWRADAIVKHLLAEQCPRDNTDDPAPVEYHLADSAIPYLRWYKPTIKVEGRTLLQILDSVIDRRRGLLWWLETGVIGEEPDEQLIAYLRVTSANPGVTTLPPEYDPPEDPLPSVPANDNQESIAGPAAFPTLEPIKVSYNGARKYHRVRVRGARRTTTFSAHGSSAEAPLVTVIDINSTIEGIWSDSEEAAYLTGLDGIDPDYATWTAEEKAKKNDIYRRTARFERVFRYFAITTEAASGLELCPKFVQSTGSIVGEFEMEPLNQRLLAVTPLKVGWDYEDATEPTKTGDAPVKEEFLRPFVAFYLPGATGYVPTTLGSADGGWRFSDKLSAQDEIGYLVGETPADGATPKIKANFHLRTIAGRSGFMLTVSGFGGLNHALFPGVFAEGVAEPSEYGEGGVNWDAMLITGTVEWDCYCEAVWPEVAPAAAPVEELLISMGERYRFDWLAKGTVYDLDDLGKVQQVEIGGAIRDDRKICEQIAQLAYNWYGIERATLQLNFQSLEQPYDLGVLITAIGVAEAQRTVNSVVTQITHDMLHGNTVYQCGFGELDFTGFA